MEQFLEGMQFYLSGSPIIALGAALLAGIIASATPCTYPMIPITVAIIGSKSASDDCGRASAFFHSVLYVSGMATMYALLGMFAALTGNFFGEINSNPWVQFGMANLLFVLGLIMIDVIPMRTLSANIKTDALSGKKGIFVMGILSGLIAGPCTAPVLGVILAYVATTKSVVMGGASLFVFAFGMGTILILAGTFSGFISALPKSGQWMVRVKVGIALLMFGAGEYFLIKTGEMLL